MWIQWIKDAMQGNKVADIVKVLDSAVSNHPGIIISYYNKLIMYSIGCHLESVYSVRSDSAGRCI